jgi:putative alpha-1,2-mannosidase
VFPRATVWFGDGRTLEIISQGHGVYVQSVELNGHSYGTAWLPLGQLSAGHNRLEFTLGTKANQAWASRPDQLPPSFDIPGN